MRPLKVVRDHGRIITYVAWRFRWRKRRRAARRDPKQAAVLAAEALVSRW